MLLAPHLGFGAIAEGCRVDLAQIHRDDRGPWWQRDSRAIVDGHMPGVVASRGVLDQLYLAEGSIRQRT